MYYIEIKTLGVGAGGRGQTSSFVVLFFSTRGVGYIVYRINYIPRASRRIPPFKVRSVKNNTIQR